MGQAGSPGYPPAAPATNCSQGGWMERHSLPGCGGLFWMTGLLCKYNTGAQSPAHASAVTEAHPTKNPTTNQTLLWFSHGSDCSNKTTRYVPKPDKRAFLLCVVATVTSTERWLQTLPNERGQPPRAAAAEQRGGVGTLLSKAI